MNKELGIGNTSSFRKDICGPSFNWKQLNFSLDKDNKNDKNDKKTFQECENGTVI